MNIDELAKRKVELQSTLNAISICNISFIEVDKLIQLEISRINAQKELIEVERSIHKYINGFHDDFKLEKNESI